MIRKTKQPFWALLIVKDGVEKVLALVSDEYHVQLAQHIAQINGLDGWLSTQVPRVAVDFKEVSGGI